MQPHLKALVLACAIAGFAPGSARADLFKDELPPANAKPLSEIIKTVEDRGYKAISEVEFDDGVWKIEAHQPDGKEVHIKVDALSGAIR